jgi:regulator of replication initiation timing
MSHYLIF